MTHSDFDDMLDRVDSIFGQSRVLGFQPMFRDLRSFVGPAATYPPHNIIKVNDNSWFIEVAVAGFLLSDLNVTVEDSKLTISVSSSRAENNGVEYVHQGIAQRDFNLTFRLGDHMEVGEAFYKNGMLVVSVERVVPQEKLPRSIKINQLAEGETKDPITEK